MWQCAASSVPPLWSSSSCAVSFARTRTVVQSFTIRTVGTKRRLGAHWQVRTLGANDVPKPAAFPKRRSLLPHTREASCGSIVCAAECPNRMSIMQSGTQRFCKGSKSKGTPFGMYQTDTAFKKSLASSVRGARPQCICRLAFRICWGADSSTSMSGSAQAMRAPLCRFAAVLRVVV